MNPIWLIRMKRWVQNPPSWGRVKLVVAVVLACAALVVWERTFGWPEALSVERTARPAIR